MLLFSRLFSTINTAKVQNAKRRSYGNAVSRRDLPNAAPFVVWTHPPRLRGNRLRNSSPRSVLSYHPRDTVRTRLLLPPRQSRKNMAGGLCDAGEKHSARTTSKTPTQRQRPRRKPFPANSADVVKHRRGQTRVLRTTSVLRGGRHGNVETRHPDVGGKLDIKMLNNKCCARIKPSKLDFYHTGDRQKTRPSNMKHCTFCLNDV